MTSLERFMAAVRFQKVDRMPTDLHNFSICARISGLPFDRFVMDPHAMAETQIALRHEFGHDVLLVENGTASLAQAMGCEVCLRSDDPPVVVGPAVRSLEDLDKLESLVNSGAIIDAPLISAGLETVRILRRELGDDTVVMGRGDQGPFSLASQVLGMGELLEALTDEDMEEPVERLLDICARQHRMLHGDAGSRGPLHVDGRQYRRTGCDLAGDVQAFCPALRTQRRGCHT